jgi:hypothetical protein
VLIASSPELDWRYTKNSSTVVSNTFEGNGRKRFFTFAFVVVTSRTSTPFDMNHIDRAFGARKVLISIIPHSILQLIHISGVENVFDFILFIFSRNRWKNLRCSILDMFVSVVH